MVLFIFNALDWSFISVDAMTTDFITENVYQVVYL